MHPHCWPQVVESQMELIRNETQEKHAAETLLGMASGTVETLGCAWDTGFTSSRLETAETHSSTGLSRTFLGFGARLVGITFQQQESSSSLGKRNVRTLETCRHYDNNSCERSRTHMTCRHCVSKAKSCFPLRRTCWQNSLIKSRSYASYMHRGGENH